MKYQLPISALLAMTVSAASAQVASHAPTAITNTASAQTSPLQVSDKPVARVNGAVLTDRDVLREMYTIFPYAQQHNGFPKAQEATIRQGALEMIIFEELVYQEAERRKVRAFIGFRDPTGNHVELVVRPERSGRRYFASRDAGITGFSHIGLNSTDPARDERFWTQVCNARVSDRIGDIPLMRVNAIHHTIALVRAPKAGIQHINHQVETSDDVLRSYYFLNERRVPIVFGPGRHPTSGARFLYFRGPDGMIFEYSVGVDEIEDEATHRPRQFGFEPTSFCMWGSKPAGMPLPTS